MTKNHPMPKARQWLDRSNIHLLQPYCFHPKGLFYLPYRLTLHILADAVRNLPGTVRKKLLGKEEEDNSIKNIVSINLGGPLGAVRILRWGGKVRCNTCLENPQSGWNRFPSGWMDRWMLCKIENLDNHFFCIIKDNNN